MQILTSAVSSFDEFSIWRKFRNGELSAFDCIYSRYAPILFNYGMQLVNDKDLVKDSMHDLFVYLWQKKDRLGEVNSLKGYLLVSFKRKLSEEKSKRGIKGQNRSGKETVFDVGRSHEDGLIALEIEKERLMKLQVAFSQLSDRQKEAIFLRFHENLEYYQIAEALGLKDAKYARTLIYRSISDLKETLSKKDIDFLSHAGEHLWFFLLFLSLPN